MGGQKDTCKRQFSSYGKTLYLTTSISPILDMKKLSVKDLVIGICQGLYSSPGWLNS